MKRDMLPICANDIDPPTPKLIDLKATIQSRFGCCAPGWICRSAEKLLGLDRLNRVYAAYHKSAETGKGERSYFEAAIKKFMGDDNYGRFVAVNGLCGSPQSVKRPARGDEAAA
jgi:hypothetical protein